jgi:hypothetical protein
MLKHFKDKGAVTYRLKPLTLFELGIAGLD